MWLYFGAGMIVGGILLFIVLFAIYNSKTVTSQTNTALANIIYPVVKEFVLKDQYTILELMDCARNQNTKRMIEIEQEAKNTIRDLEYDNEE